MALYAIHTSCDVCDVGSANYEAFPLCRYCLTQVCPAHAAPGTEEYDSDSGTLRYVTCRRCDQEDTCPCNDDCPGEECSCPCHTISVIYPQEVAS